MQAKKMYKTVVPLQHMISTLKFSLYVDFFDCIEELKRHTVVISGQLYCIVL